MQSTLAMLRKSCQAKACLFFVFDDGGNLVLRAGDGPAAKLKISKQLNPAAEPYRSCMRRNRLVEYSPNGPGHSMIIVPVSGEKRTLGILLLGPYTSQGKLSHYETELRSAATLCAVLSANWRLYDWMSGFLSQINHELRTPLTAVQGSLGMVLGGVFGEVGGEVKDMLEMAQKGCERTVKAIEDYLNAKKLNVNT